MAEFKPGEIVAVPATVRGGAFSGERLVTVATTTGQVSGFVQFRDVVEQDGTIHALVRDSTPNSLTVQLPGTYFTTNGVAELPADWARRHVKVVQ
jgi:hypothetical protein